MSDPNFLSHFIREKIYLVDEDLNQKEKPAVPEKCHIVVPETLTADDATFLYKIFSAVNIKEDELEISSADRISDDRFIATFYFGVKPPGLDQELYQFHAEQGNPHILAHSLAEIAKNNSLKRKLWSVLRACFQN